MQTVLTTPDAPGKLIFGEAPIPAAGPGLAVVRVLASSINRGETRLVPSRPNGWMPGQDVAGTIEVAATDGGPAKGTRVVGLVDNGSWSEYVAVPLDRLAVLPDNVDFAAAAALPVAGLTALRALRALGDVFGRRLLVTGVTGGSGNVAAQLAVAAGANVFGLVRHDFALDGVTIVRSLDGPQRYDRAIDTVAGDVLTAVLGKLTPHAKVVFFSGGPPAQLSLGAFAGVPATVEALYVYSAPGRFDEDLATLAQAVSTGKLRPLIDRRVPMAQVNEALAALNAGGIIGKVVLVRDSAA